MCSSGIVINIRMFTSINMKQKCEICITIAKLLSTSNVLNKPNTWIQISIWGNAHMLVFVLNYQHIAQ